MELQSDRRFFSFQLKTMLVIFTAIAVVLGLVVQEMRHEYKKKQADEQISLLALGHVTKGGEVQTTGIVNGWLRLILGDDFFTLAHSVYLKPRSSADLELLFCYPESKMLELEGVGVTDDSWSRLSRLTQLEFLTLRSTALDDFRPLAKLPNLISLSLSDCSLSEENLDTLSKLPNLQSLSFKNCPVTDSNLRTLSGSQSLEHLGLSESKVTEAGLLEIWKANPNLSIDYEWGSTGSYELRINGRLPSRQESLQFSELTYTGPLTTGATLAALKDRSELTKLALDRCNLSDGDLQHLQAFKNLTTLYVSQSSITDDGLRMLQGLSKLQHLSLYGTQVEGVGVKDLPSSIKTLRLSNPVTNRGVISISKLNTIEALYLEGDQVTDEVIDDLAKLTSLRTLELYTAISEVGVKRLIRAMPNCKISSQYGIGKFEQTE